MGQHWRLFLATGVLGGFTTFSAFSLDFAILWERGAMGGAAVYLVASVVGSLVAIFAALAVARAIWGRWPGPDCAGRHRNRNVARNVGTAQMGRPCCISAGLLLAASRSSIPLAAFASPALAQMLAPVVQGLRRHERRGPGEDEGALRKAVDQKKVGATADWSSSSGRAGHVEILELFEKNGMECQTVKHTFTGRWRETLYALPALCKGGVAGAIGSWREDRPSLPEGRGALAFTPAFSPTVQASRR